MVAVSVQQMAERISDLLGQKYRVSGDLATQAARLRRRLPARVNAALQVLDRAAYMAQTPRLSVQIDMAVVAEAYDLALTHLNGVDAKDRRKGLVVGIGASIGFSLLMVALLLVAVLRWRGFL